MRAKLIVVIVLVGVFIFAHGPMIAEAEESNRGEVRANLAAGGWQIVYGDLINEGDYVEFVAAVAAAVACECPAPIQVWFDNQINAQVTKMQTAAPGVATDYLIRLLIESLDNNGQIFRTGRLELSAGLATYRRWETVIYDEPRTYRCKQNLPFGGWTWVPCTTVERVTREVPLPNNFQPYIRFRVTGTDATTGTTGQGGLTFVNSSAQRLCIAVGQYSGSLALWVSDGWWCVEPNQSIKPVSVLNYRYYYYYILGRNEQYSEDRGFWVNMGAKFEDVSRDLNSSAAASRGLVWKSFHMVDTGANTSQTVTLR